ncbi:hypothetical protein KY290_012359 [Solanum tuberosum]|uniref:Uncharacterized protein n=1 Tax=Solanum tuberosum TaxID=4113 RepID=A0ABQ7W390_SOLTU|nr:hypothetical protein KY290_012359 [Solanum tuberosum]
MHEIDVHDLSDDADYAASVQQGSASMNRSNSSKQGSSGEQEGAEIVFLKDNVAIHPTQYASERISGRLKLIKQGDNEDHFPFRLCASEAFLLQKFQAF